MSAQAISWFLLGLVGTGVGCVESRCLADFQADCSSVDVTPTDLLKDFDRTLTMTIDGTLFNDAIQAKEGLKVTLRSMEQSVQPVQLLDSDHELVPKDYVLGHGQRYELKLSGGQLAPLRVGPVTLEVTAGGHSSQRPEPLQVQSFFLTGPFKIPIAAVSLGFVGSPSRLISLEKGAANYNIAKYGLVAASAGDQYTLPTVQRTSLDYSNCSSVTNRTELLSYCFSRILGASKYVLDRHLLAADFGPGTHLWEPDQQRPDVQVLNPLLVLDPEDQFVVVTTMTGLLAIDMKAPSSQLGIPVADLDPTSPQIVALAAGPLDDSQHSAVVVARQFGVWDVLTGLPSAPQRDALRSQGLASFWAAQNLPQPRALTLASVSGHAQLLALAKGAPELLVLTAPQAKPDWQLQRVRLPALRLAPGDDVVALMVGDVDGDRDLDLLVSTGPSGASPPEVTALYIYRNQPE